MSLEDPKLIPAPGEGVIDSPRLIPGRSNPSLVYKFRRYLRRIRLEAAARQEKLDKLIYESQKRAFYNKCGFTEKCSCGHLIHRVYSNYQDEARQKWGLLDSHVCPNCGRRLVPAMGLVWA